MAEEAKEVQQEVTKKTKPQFSKVEQLSPASVGFNLIVKVASIEPIMNRLNLDKSTLKISEATVGDATASIILSLRNDQIEQVKVGDCLILRNAKIDMVNNGYMRVAIDRWGVIETVDEAQSSDKINTENNLSLVEYELVKEPNNDDNRGYGGRRRGGYGGRGRRGGRGRGGGGYGYGRGRRRGRYPNYGSGRF